MKILLDENLSKQLKADFEPDYDVKNVRDMGWLGKKDGELLGLIVFNGFDFFVTIDKNLFYQQNLDRIELKIFLLPLNAHFNILWRYTFNCCFAVLSWVIPLSNSLKSSSILETMVSCSLIGGEGIGSFENTEIQYRL